MIRGVTGAITANRCRLSPSVRLRILAALVLLTWSDVRAQPETQRQELRQQMIEAVRQGNESVVLDLIREPAGRQELLALSDNFVFEIRAAKMFAASLPRSPEVRKGLRQTELSLLRQTDDESVVMELCLGLLVSEIRALRDPSLALTLADALYDDVQKDLNDVVVRKGKVVLGEKTKTMLEMAASLTKTAADPGQVAFLKRILARARVSPNRSAGALTTEAPIPREASAFKKTVPRVSVWKLLLAYTEFFLIVLLVATIGWRINKLRTG